MISQITYCAARLQQDGNSPVIPITAQYLLRELIEMRQWSRESKDWDTVKSEPAVIESVRCLPQGYLIDSHEDMMAVTAEAWRIASIAYLQCRVLRQVACSSADIDDH